MTDTSRRLHLPYVLDCCRGRRSSKSKTAQTEHHLQHGETGRQDLSKKVGRLFASYTGVFVLGFGCSLLGWPMHEKVQSATAVVSRAYDEVLWEAVERLMNGTLKLREVLDHQAAAVTDRVKNASVGVKEYLGGLAVPTMLGGQEDERVGVRMAKLGARVHNPVVMIPGIITTGLEVWDGEACIRSYFRQRIWGSSTMLQSIISDPDCWVRHLSLNATTGLDPLQSPHFNRSIRIRPSQGFESADFFVAGYWLWGLMIEALADVGYDLNSMHMASYDWRLSFAHLEHRDRYFTRLRQHIETLVYMNGQKAVVVGHSMGSNVWHYFMQWVTYHVHKNWIHDHIYAEIDISSPLLGLPKAFYSLLTGDNRDFASMGRGFSAVMTHLFGPMTRRRMWRSCSSLAMMMPIGGETIWGEAVTGSPLVRVGGRPLNVSEAYDLLAREGAVPGELQRISPWLLEGLRRARPPEPAGRSAGGGLGGGSGGGSAPGGAERSALVPEPPEAHWANVLAVPLPFAPDLRKYSFYGVGVPTDVSAVLQETGDDADHPRYSIDKAATDHFGFLLADGDYAVPVRSLGLMCFKGWKDDRRNPARIPCTIREYLDNPRVVGKNANGPTGQAKASPAQTMYALLTGGYNRGGQPSGDHIDILGNQELLQDVLTIVSGGEVQERIISDIRAIADKWVDA